MSAGGVKMRSSLPRRSTRRGSPPPYEGGCVKKVDRSAQIGDAGIALIHSMVNAMGYVWHERKTDAGIDGEVELRNPTTGEVVNRLLMVQSKASNNPFPGENDQRFHFVCRADDVDYWMSADVPVLLVCSHPERGDAWWVHVQGWFSDPARRASGRVDFDKSTQRFDRTASERLLSLADPHGAAHTPVADIRREELTSNLLRVVLPDFWYSTPTTAGGFRDVFDGQRTTKEPIRFDWTLHQGRMLTWLPPEETALRAVAAGHTTPIPIEELYRSSGDQGHRQVVRMLNQALRQDVSRDCDFDKGRNLVYFRAANGLHTKKILSSTGRARTVFNTKQKQDGSGVSYCKHAALKWQFTQPGDGWLCALSPTYYYTRDGKSESKFTDKLLSGIKRMERNAAVLGTTLMWAAYLRGEDHLLEQTDTILDYGELLTFAVDRGINDADWLADDRSLPEREGTSDEHVLF